MFCAHDDYDLHLDDVVSDRFYIAVDIGGTKIASAIVRMSYGTYEVIDKNRMPTCAQKGGDDVLYHLVDFIERQFRLASKQGIPITGIGIGTAGVVDSEHGRIAAATNIMPGWAGQHVAQAIHESDLVGHLPVYMVGDVGAHGLGESQYGAGRGHESVLSVGVGTGIGGAIIRSGELITGAHGVAGHVGHISHALGVGVTCSCGTTCGHIEPVASGTGLATLYNLLRSENSTIENGQEYVQPARSGLDVVNRMNEGEHFARRVIEISATALGECIAGMANLLDPDVIVLSGSVVKAGEVWWQGVYTGFSHAALPLISATPIIQGNLGDDAPLVGAAYAVSEYIKTL